MNDKLFRCCCSVAAAAFAVGVIKLYKYFGSFHSGWRAQLALLFIQSPRVQKKELAFN